MLFNDRLISNARHDIDKAIYADEFHGAKVERPGVMRPHDAIDTFDTVVDIHERARLATVSPDLDRVA